MTDGLLLAEIQRDRLLRRYDTIIIDEAHERSLNIDFLLGYLKRILPARPDLKVIVTSATIDPERFAEHFGDAPIIEVSGRTYPVEVRYREPDEDTDQTDAIGDAVEELLRERPGDILVFLSGEREIRDTADALEGRLRIDVEILPLFARQSTAAQQRVWKPHSNRRVVLATNVAETSLTVPGIHYVVDPGTARISRYSARLKVQRLPIEPVSPGVRRPAQGPLRAHRRRHRDPAVLRGGLRGAPALHRPGDPAHEPRRGDPADGGDRPRRRRGLPVPGPAGPPPGARRHRAAAGARRARRDRPQADAARAPARGAADRPADGPDGARGRPAGLRRGGDRDRRRAVDPGRRASAPPTSRRRPTRRTPATPTSNSDFLAYLNLWRYLHERRGELSVNQFRKQAKGEFLHYLRIREWQDLVGQIRQAAKSVGIKINHTPAEPEAIHQAILTGLLSHLGLRDAGRRDYLGARGGRFALWPGSGVKGQPSWVMVSELVETSRLWGRTAARIDPRWVEPLAEHLVRAHATRSRAGRRSAPRSSPPSA